MKVTIGILAYNESALIAKAIESLVKQNIFQDVSQDLKFEIIVVPNGCTDDTASIASIALDSFFSSLSDHVTWQVVEQESPGKTNAWNVYVHELSDPEAQYLFLMDSDIEILDPNTFKSMLHTLEKYPEAWISVDKPIKDVLFKETKTILDRMSIFVSGLSGGNPRIEGPAWICGQLYCARASRLREIFLPSNLQADDSFLYTMTVTDGLRTEANPNRVILADSATHKFEAYTQLNRLLRHEKWLIVSSAINEIVFDFLKDRRQDELHIGSQIKQLNEADPNWLRQCTQKAVKKKGFWVIPRFILIRRFVSLRHKPLLKSLLLLPISCIAFGTDLILAIQANRDLHRSSQVGYWGK